jgi:hypothetical protein
VPNPPLQPLAGVRYGIEVRRVFARRRLSGSVKAHRASTASLGTLRGIEMSEAVPTRIRQWRAAWVALACAIALHVTDEALTGFLPMYNEIVRVIRSRHPWVPLPTFRFSVWLGGLVLGVVLLLGLTPLVSRGQAWILIASLVLAVLMVGNALGHFAGSLYLGRAAPGVYSSPFLLIAAVGLFVTAWRARHPG